MPQIFADELARRWSTRLGLASTPLFSPESATAEHYALLDGVTGSFAISASAMEPSRGVDWAWSANLGHHVFVGDDRVSVRNVSGSAIRRFDRNVVEQKLERFFDYILRDPNKPAIDAIAHIINVFRSHRHHLFSCNVDQDLSLPTFLLCLANVKHRQDGTAFPDIAGLANGYGLESASYEAALTPDYLNRFDDQVRFNTTIGRELDVRLTIRHAAGALFQEANAELSRDIGRQGVLWGLPTFVDTKTSNAAGVYFTPPGLARTMADLTLRPYLLKDTITIFDPACGSGIFLCEALHSLRRYGYGGHINLIGFDISASAIQMAHFAIDESDELSNAEVRIERCDFLTDCPSLGLEVDVVLMNPPFVNFSALGSQQQDLMRARLGDMFRYRPDLSVLFAHEALMSVAPHGTLACLLPVGALSSDSSANWRRAIARDNTVELVAVLGDHGLFRNVMVNAGVLVVRKVSPHPESNTIMLWGSQHAGSGAAALRGLRRWITGAPTLTRQDDWALYSVNHEDLAQRDRWLPAPNALGSLKTRLETSISHRIGELFRIELGIRSGDRDRFVVDQDFINRLTRSERQYFRPIAETSSIANGRISARRWLFYPMRNMTIAEIQKECPRYYARFIECGEDPPNQIIHLARPRKRTYTSAESRIVSRAFASVGGFAVDAGSKHVVVTGYAWIPTKTLRDTVEDLDLILQDYCFIFNSRIFGLLAREYGQLQSGGQTDFAQKFMKQVPMPHLPTVYAERLTVLNDAERLRRLDTVRFPDVSELDSFAAEAFGTLLSDWPIA
jgi:adenine-specific DNA-methyltransferase